MHTAIDIPGPERVRFHRAKSKFFTITRVPNKRTLRNVNIQNIEKVNQTLCCGFSLESSRRDDSNEYLQHRDWKRSN